MSAVHAVLLVPEEGDPLGLLADGPCGARPPAVVRFWCFSGQHSRWAAKPSDEPCGCRESLDDDGRPLAGTNRCAFVTEDDGDCALVLAWEGRALPLGAAHVAACKASPDRSMWFIYHAVLEGMRHPSTIPSNLRWTSTLGTLVILDADGREVAA